MIIGPTHAERVLVRVQIVAVLLLAAFAIPLASLGLAYLGPAMFPVMIAVDLLGPVVAMFIGVLTVQAARRYVAGLDEPRPWPDRTLVVVATIWLVYWGIVLAQIIAWTLGLTLEITDRASSLAFDLAWLGGSVVLALAAGGAAQRLNTTSGGPLVAPSRIRGLMWWAVVIAAGRLVAWRTAGAIFASAVAAGGRPPGGLTSVLTFGPIVVTLIWTVCLLITARDARRALAGIVPRACPECGYDLRDDRDAGCPECGWGRAPAA